MTEKQAVQLALDLWTWLAKNPMGEKLDWPRFEEIQDLEDYCPLCEFHDVECSSCCLNRAGVCASEADDDAYAQWAHGYNPAANAAKIRNVLAARLKVLSKLKRKAAK